MTSLSHRDRAWLHEGHLPRAVFTDLDGTLLRQDGSVSSLTRSVVERCRARGIYVVPVTGRSWVGAAAALGWIAAPTPIICLNGSLSCDLLTGTVDVQQPIDPPALKELVSRLAARGVPVVVDANTCKYGSPGSDDLMKVLPPGPRDLLSDLDRIPRAYSVIASCVATADVTTVVGELATLRCVQSSEHCLVITEARATKVDAVRRLCAKFGISPADAIAFGDAENDLEMLGFVGHGVAMANSAPTVRASTRYVTRYSNEDDGVAQYLLDIVGAGRPQ